MRYFFIFFLLCFVSCTKKSEEQSVGKEDHIQTNQYEKDTLKKDTVIINEEIRDISYGVKNIPRDIEYKGKVVASASWKDKNGSNIVLITETEEKTNPEGEITKELYGYQYILDSSGAELLWKIQDFIRDCPVDVSLSYIENSLSVTDINKNGIGESTFLYRISCKGDVSPDGLKLMMHEGKNKYAIRGNMVLELNGEKLGGDRVPDNSFKKAPDGFLRQAEKMWEKFHKQTN